MSGRILIVETTASQRILLRGVLEAAHFAVQAAPDLATALARIAAEPPELMLVDIGAEPAAALAMIAALRDSGTTAALPVIATACAPGPEARLAALRAGADDVLDKRGDPAFLLARIRSLLRGRDASADLGIGDGAARALGMADPAGAFVPAGRTAIVTRRPGALPPALAALADRLPGGAVLLDPGAELAAQAASGGAPTDLYIIDHAPEAAEKATNLFRLIADLQSRPATRLAKMLVMVPAGAAGLGEMALDLGADDLAEDDIGAEELAFRVRALLRRKSRADRLRVGLQSGIEAALTDALTGLSNRRFAMAELNRLAERAASGGGGFAVIILDIDHFKRINDGHGHAAGDAVLLEVARLLRANLRAVDLVARIGGEEFLIAMPDTGADLARLVAERLRRVVEQAGFDIDTRGGGRVRVTLSAGVADGAALIGAADPVAAICDRADRALYAAKSAGRNMVTVAPAAA